MCPQTNYMHSGVILSSAAPDIRARAPEQRAGMRVCKCQWAGSAGAKKKVGRLKKEWKGGQRVRLGGKKRGERPSETEVTAFCSLIHTWHATTSSCSIHCNRITQCYTKRRESLGALLEAAHRIPYCGPSWPGPDSALCSHLKTQPLTLSASASVPSILKPLATVPLFIHLSLPKTSFSPFHL